MADPQAITIKDVLAVVGGIILAIVTPIVGWVLNSVLKLKEDTLSLRHENTQLKEKVAVLEKKEEDKITRECVREEIDAALERRDKQAEQRYAERANTRRLEMKEIVDESLEKLAPRLLRELRSGGSGGGRLTPAPPGDEG